MPIKIAINGYGRIGRLVHRRAIEDENIEVVAINASYDPTVLAHLLKYDTVHGQMKLEISADNDNKTMTVNGKTIQIIAERNPEKLPWGDLGIDIAVEATGKFTDRKGASLHLQAGAKKVCITAPGKDEDITIVMGVNEEQYDKENHHIVSNASCTTNCLAPVVKVLHETFGVVQGLMTTVHSYTNDQKNLDNPHKDLRRARACAESIIPTSTGAAKAVGRVLPELEGKLNGISLRVPTPNVSIVDLVVELETSVTKDQINQALKSAAEQKLKGILEFCDEPLVSSDFIGNSHSSIIDGLTTMTMGDKTAKVFAWYDNEWGYSCRVIDLVKYMMK
ncbi:type I glyceraldehyde-3-phosphate dehydrogenase [Desulfuribacillus stibiiarsenatis]|uniref:Glyceraldehyde-3-phosphate dehydrogenase n=1 Tax=Desulfuribacillus stibiiarsenatis TaxID=1390249 RepID=A0A1E5L357_9FIRM|nr:type I glyceraldehyde-3-phosphate dehydrogenase [Desulfuribacillus stibiiarsenatis]